MMPPRHGAALAESTQSKTTCPPSAVADMIVPWPEVREGDALLWDGEFRPVAQVAPYGRRDEGVWAIEFADIPGEVCLPVGAYAAVRRYTEGEPAAVAELRDRIADLEGRLAIAKGMEPRCAPCPSAPRT